MKGLKFALTGLALGAAWCASAEKLVTHGDTVAMMGDSITQYGTSSDSGYPQLFLRAIRTTGVSDFTFVGAGVAGNTSTDMRNRFVRDVVNKNPTVVTINSGVNDIRFGFPAHYETYRDNLNYMVDQAKGVGAKVVLMTPTGAAGEGTNELVHALAGIMREVAADKHVTLADSYVYFRAAVEDPLAPVMGASGYKATVDGLHMGPVGDRAMARSLVSVMGLTEAEIAAVEEDWNTAPIVGISGIPSMSLAQYDKIEAYSDRFKLEIWTAAGDAFHAGLAHFLANPVIPASPTLPEVPSGAASDCAGGAIVMCGGGAWGNEAQTNPSGISRLVTKALAANGSTRPVITGRADGEYLSKIDSNFDKIVANDKDTGAAVSHLVIMPGLENITTDTQSAQNIVSKAAAKGITVVFLTYNPLKDSDGDAALNTVLRDLDNGTTVRTIDAYQMRVDEKTRRAANANAHHYIHGNGTLSPRMNYLEGTELLPMLGFNAAAAQRADARWQAIDDFGGSTVSYSIGFGELDQLRGIAFQNNVSVAELYAVCMRLGAEAIADVAPVQGQLTVDPNTMSNNCALIANTVNRIRGTAAPGVRITVYRKGVTAVGYADANGDYYVDYNPGDYEPSYKTTVSDGLNTLTFYTTLVSSIPAHDHVYGTTNYTWSADYTACTAMATCSVCTEKLFENGAVTTVTNVAQTCTTDGSVTSTAVFPTLGTDTKSATVPAGHVWGAPEYEWNTTDWTCTASASCIRDGTHKTSETVQAQYAVVTPATIYATGLGRYTATFVNAAFAAQPYDVEIPKKTGDEGLSPAGEGKDDSNAIQQAIDLAGKDGLVSLDEGTFLVNTQLMITNGVALVGKGWNKTTLKYVGAAQAGTSRVATIKDGGTLGSVTVTGGFVDGSNKHGGGILIDGTGTVSWCKVTGNKVGRGFGGGIGVIGKGKATIDHTIVSGNSAPGNAAVSSVNIPCGAGIGVTASSATEGVELLIDTCLVCDNVCGAQVSGSGGGICIQGYYVTSAVIRNTTVAGNSVSGAGGGLYMDGQKSRSSITLENNIFAANTAGGVEANVEITSVTTAPKTIADCFFGLAPEVLGTGSSAGDPGFVGDGNYHLSAALKLGYSTSETLQDLDGNERTGALDVGCYAFGGTTPVDPPQEPHEHIYPATNYNWSADHTSCTASMTCSVCKEKISESVQAQYEIVTEATESATGLGRYTATFVNPAFAPPPFDVVIPKKTSGEGLAPAGEGKDDSNAIQQAIDAAGEGGTVTLGEGTFLINTQLTIGNGVTLVGQGYDRTTLKNVAALSDVSRVATVKDGGCLMSVTVTGGAVDGANKHGGGILIDGTGTVSWCKVTGNRNLRGVGGGIGVVGKGQAMIDHTIVSGNTAPGNPAAKVNIPCGAGIGVIASGASEAVELTVDTCLVSDNACGADVSGTGGGIYIRGYYVKTAVIRNTTVAGNSVSGDGGGLYMEGVFPQATKISLENSVFAQNMVGEAEENVKIVNDKYACVTASYCFFGLTSEVLGTGSSFGDPGFVGNGNYHLSAALKLGYETEESLLDLDGYGRTGALDVGCYAFDGTTPPEPPEQPIVLGTPAARPSTDYNGSAVSVAFTGDIPDGAEVSAKITIGGVDYAGSVDDGLVTIAVPDSVVTAGNTYDATVTLSVGGKDYTKSVELVQGTPKVEEDDAWIAESASSFNQTGTWSGDKAEVVSGKIAVSNATFTAAEPSAADGQVTVETTMVFNGPSEVTLDPAARAGVQVVKVGGVNRYAFLTGNGVVTNTTATANVSGAVSVKVELDYAKDEVTYTVAGAKFGPFAATSGAKLVSSVRYVGATSVTSLDGSYRYEGLDSNLAQVGDDEYATVADAIAQAGNEAVTLLWDANWSPSAVGDYNIATNGHLLVIGGSLAYSVKDNGDGTITVTVTGGEEPSAPEAAAITIVGSTVRVAVSDVKADCWYALEKTTDLSEDFELVPDTCASGAELLAGTSELEIAVGDGEPQAFYRIVVSKTEFGK